MHEPRFTPIKMAEAEKLCESPIEASFLVAFSKRCIDEAARRTKFWTEESTDPPIIIEPQKPIGKHRVDFLISQGLTRLIVECDGHDFHERDATQAMRDRARDRLMQEQGYGVFRFTGSEIYSDPRKCAAEAFAYLDNRAVPPGGAIIRPFPKRGG